MKIKYPTQRLVERRKDDIRTWREEGASWETIAATLEKDTRWQDEGRPAVLPNSICKAWVRISGEIIGNPMISHDKAPASPVNAQIVPETTQPSEADMISREFLGNPMISRDNRPPARTNPRCADIPTLEEWESWPLKKKLEQGIPEAKPDGTRYMRPLKSDEAKLLERDARAAAFESGEL
jgi:hypothetical protein